MSGESDLIGRSACEIRDLLQQSEQQATELLSANRARLDRLVKALLEQESLDLEAIRGLVDPD